MICVKVILFYFLFLFTQNSFSANPNKITWDLNDVSYLMPLPSKNSLDLLLNVDSIGAKGELLDKELFLNQIPFLTQEISRETGWQLLRVMAVRFDSCFPLPVPQACQKQIRLVWQPLQAEADGTLIPLDAAIHSFYILEEQEYDQLLNEIQNWKLKFKVDTKGKPLQIHPAWTNYEEAPQKDFQKIVLKFIGKKNLSRVTVMLLRGSGTMWVFAAFEPDGNSWKLLNIPRLGAKSSQVFVNNSFPFENFSGGLSPIPAGDDQFNSLMTDSQPFLQKNEDQLRSQMKALLRIENPSDFSPENMDCVSCHVAQPAKHWIKNFRGDISIEDLTKNFEYKNSEFDLSNKTAEIKNTRSIRAFGYFGQNPVISQRVINESAEEVRRTFLHYNALK